MTSIQPELWVRIIDPFGHEWEIGVPLGAWPPS
jgi:hypothetical protein